MPCSLRFFSRLGLRAFSLLLLLSASLLAPAQTIRYVRIDGSGTNPATATSWATSTPNLQGAINASAAGDQVWVAQGTYKPGGNANTDRTISFSMNNGVAIYGGFPATGTPTLTERNPDSFTSVLSGDIGTAGNSADNTYHVVYNPSGITTSAVLDGFLITGGNANGPEFTSTRGGGMYNNGVRGVCSPMVRNCSFQNNSASSGGAMLNAGYSQGASSPVLTNCSFQNNSASSGGAMNNDGSSSGTSSPVLTNCSFQNNSASYQGGAMFNSRIYGGTSSPVLTNCVLFGNGGSNSIVNFYSSSVSARYSLFETGVTDYTDGGNNLTTAVSPFVSATDARLNACAPAINAGNNAANTTATDLAGNSRVYQNGRIDMGAYEYQGDPISIIQQPPSGWAVCAGATVTTSVSTTGTVSAYQWYQDGALLSGQTSATLTLTNVQPAQSGSYSVVLTGACNSVTSTAFSLTVNAQPVATLRASPSTVLSCAQTSLTLTAGGGNNYFFTGPGIVSQTGNQAVINAPGSYSVTVTNTATGCTNTASVVVGQDNSQPTVRIDPTTATLSCGAPRVTLTATTSASSLTWSTGQTTPSISVSVAGTYSVTATSANGCVAMAQATVSGTTEAPAAPTLSANPATTTTNQPITVTANGCTGGVINWTALGGTGQASGNTYTLSQPGNYTLSASCTLNGCTSSQSPPLSVQIRPGGFAITGVNMVNCQLIDEARGQYQVQFTPQYTGQNNSLISFAVVNELAATTAPAPYSLRLYTDNPVITLVANQAGNSEARFAYNWLASCRTGTSPNQPPTTTGIPSQTIVQSQGYQLQLTSYFSDPDGQQLSFQASGLPAGLSLTGSVISGTPSQAGVSSVNVTAIDPGGLPVSTSFQLTVSAMPVTPPTGFAIVGVSTVSCQVLSAGERRLTFTPQYAGVSGDPISFSVVNELVATTSPGPYSLNLYTDNPTITLSAQQGATVSTYRYDWLAVCTPAARVGSGEAGSRLTVRVLGNPVAGNTAEVEISGVSGQAVQLNLVDLQGKSVTSQRIEQAGAVERVSLSLGASNGVLLLQVSTPTQRQQVKLLRTN